MTRFLPLLLALMLALTSQSMAVARGASVATGHMVLCTGTGTVAVYTDAQGQPTQAPHICPDATLNLVEDGPMPDVQAPWTLLTVGVTRSITKSIPLQLPRIAAQSRAPPLTV